MDGYRPCVNEKSLNKVCESPLKKIGQYDAIKASCKYFEALIKIDVKGNRLSWQLGQGATVVVRLPRE